LNFRFAHWKLDLVIGNIITLATFIKHNLNAANREDSQETTYLKQLSFVARANSPVHLTEVLRVGGKCQSYGD
jgi:hypothetical protein